MPMSSLDPSMLLGFLIQDHDDWQDFCARMSAVSNQPVRFPGIAFALLSLSL